MTVFAANITSDTAELLHKVTHTELQELSRGCNLNLSDKTILIRLALYNLIKNPPRVDEVLSNKASFLRPTEFDGFLKKILEEKL